MDSAGPDHVRGTQESFNPQPDVRQWILAFKDDLDPRVAMVSRAAPNIAAKAVRAIERLGGNIVNTLVQPKRFANPNSKAVAVRLFFALEHIAQRQPLQKVPVGAGHPLIMESFAPPA